MQLNVRVPLYSVEIVGDAFIHIASGPEKNVALCTGAEGQKSLYPADRYNYAAPGFCQSCANNHKEIRQVSIQALDQWKAEHTASEEKPGRRRITNIRW